MDKKRFCVARLGGLVAVIAGMLAMPQGAEASSEFSLSFERITANANNNIADQLSVLVKDESGDIVSFRFSNVGTFESSLARIYFDFSSDILAQIGNSSFGDASSGVNFSTSFPGPPDLPAGNTVGFSADRAFGATVPPPHQAVQLGEFVTINFEFFGDFGDLEHSLLYGQTRIGLHVISIEGGGLDGWDPNEAPSDAFVTTIVPLPAAAWSGMAMLGLLAGGSVFRKRLHRAERAV